MKMISNKLYLAINAAFFIAYNGNDDCPVSGSAIVEYSNLNKRALESVLQRLSNAGVIISVKGAKGGYYMPNPQATTLEDVARAFINTVVPQKHDFAGFGDALFAPLKESHDVWLETLSHTTFKQLCSTARDSGEILQQDDPILNFAI